MISVIIPAYNEEKRIGKTLEKLSKEKIEEIIVVFDGDDNTDKIVKRFKEVKLLKFKKRLGKGNAIKAGFKKAKGSIIVFVDADYGYKEARIKDLTKWIKYYDIVIGSRNRKLEKNIFRRIVSYGFNLLTKLILGLNIDDTQCGFKVFKRNVLKDLIQKIKTGGYVFDVELLYLAKEKYSIKEVSLKWTFEKHSKINLFRDSIKMFIELIKIRWIH